MTAGGGERGLWLDDATHREDLFPEAAFGKKTTVGFLPLMRKGGIVYRGRLRASAENRAPWGCLGAIVYARGRFFSVS